MRTRQFDLSRPTWATGFALACHVAALCASPALAQDPSAKIVDTSTFAPIQSTARTVPEIVHELASRRAASAPRATLPSNLAAGEVGSNYDWGIQQTWLPDQNGVQWCVDGYQSVQPIGGVKLYVLPRAYAGLHSLQPEALVVTLDAEEQIPHQVQEARAKAPEMPHEFAYGTCVLPEFTQVGTYSTVAYSCGTERECAASPRVSATVLNLKPLLASFDICVDRQANQVQFFVGALYLDQRPEPSSIRVTLDGQAIVDSQAQAEWPWVLTSSTIPLADYDSRFGTSGAFATVGLSSDNRFTPRAKLFFTKSDWLSPCID